MREELPRGMASARLAVVDVQIRVGAVGPGADLGDLRRDLPRQTVFVIGGFNNPWTLRLSEGLRFTLATDTNGNYIRDRDRPSDRQWHLGPADTRIKDVAQTYGLITRVREPDTGQWVLAVSGLMLGTRAAAECLVDSGCLQSAEALSRTPRGESNVQIVVSAAVIREDSGAPQVLTTPTWSLRHPVPGAGIGWRFVPSDASPEVRRPPAEPS